MTARKQPARIVRPRTATTRIIEHSMWQPGLYVAPFRVSAGDGGALALIAIDYEHRFGGLFTIEAGRANFEVQTVTHYARGGEPHIMTLEYDDAELFGSRELMEWLPGGNGEWAPGVHLAPWYARGVPDGRVLVHIAPNGQLWGMTEAPAPLRKTVIDDALSFYDTGVVFDGTDPHIINYDEQVTIDRVEYDRLHAVSRQYEKDREEYGRLIGIGVQHGGETEG
jgi:hypothetical protein